MSAETNVYDLLRTNAGVLAALGGQERIYPQIIFAPEDGSAPPLPAVVYSLTETEEFADLYGTVQVGRHRFDVQAWSRTRDEADAVLAACRAALAASNIPIVMRASTFDTDVGLHAASLSFDYWA